MTTDHGVIEVQRRFFSMLLADSVGDIELRRLTFDTALDKYGSPQSMAGRDIDKLLAFSTNGGGDMFHGINLRKPGISNAEKSDIAEIRCVAVDIDFKTTTKAAFERALAKFPLKPSLVIDSGNGRHLYWFLVTPLVVSGDEQIKLAEGISKGIAQRLGGDSTHDVTRILRTPGRENSKYIHRPLCRIIIDDGPRYNIENLKQFWQMSSSSNAKAKLDDIPDELPQRFQTLLAKHRAIAATWRGERPDLKDQSGSGYDMAMAALLVSQGFCDNEIAAILRRMPSGKGAAATEAYLSHTIGKARQSRARPQQSPGSKPLCELLQGVEEEEVDFLWDKRIPRGKTTLFDGDPGVGKSYVALTIAAAISNGKALPFDKEPEAPLRSLIISAEDGYGDTIKPRLRKLGADMSMIAIPNREMGFTPASINANLVDRMLAEFPAALIILDPVIAYANGKNTDRASDVRGVLGPLAMVAEKRKAALVLIRHLNKSPQSKALYRGQGSIDFAAICRSVFVFAQDSDNPERRLMAHAKASLAGLQPTVEFFIDSDGGFRWGGETSDTADEALGTGEPKRERESKQLDAATRFLQDALSTGPMSSNDVKTKAQKAGISWRTVWRGKEMLDIRASKERGTGEWFWRLA